MSRFLRSSQPQPFPSTMYSRRGMTLVEVMVAMVVFVLSTMGVYSALIKSYQLAALSRCRNEARAILRTYVDQFTRLQTTYVDPVSGESGSRWLFVAGGPTGRGLKWGALSDGNTTVNAEDVPYLTVSMNTNGAPIEATVTRLVEYLDTSTGEVLESPQIGAAGYMLKGTFAITYSINQQDYTESLSVARAVP